MDPDAFAKYLAEDVTMVFGNGEPIEGREAARETWASFCELVDGVRHEVVNRWELDDATIAETNVTYTRGDWQAVTVPVVTIYSVGGDDLITDYRVFLDLAPVFAEDA